MEVFVVRCLGEEHEIVQMPNGHLHLVHHDYAAELLAEKMGGTLPACCQILKKVKGKGTWVEYGCLKQLFSTNEALRTHRRNHREYERKLARSFQEKYAERLLPHLTDCLGKTRYRQPTGQFITDFVVYAGDACTIWEIPYSCCGCGCCEVCYNGCRPQQLGIKINWEWQKVVNRGIEIIDGMIVLDILSENDVFIEILIAKQYPDFYVKKVKALIRKSNGELIWLPEVTPHLTISRASGNMCCEHYD